MEMTRSELARYLDHSLLDVRASRDDVVKLCEVAAAEGVAAVCVSAPRVALAADVLADSIVAVASVAGFPSGLHRPEVKCGEIWSSVMDGADEIDVVVNLANVFDGSWGAVANELRGFRIAAADTVVKLILETAVLSESQIVALCEMAVAAGIDIVKTSTGMHAAGGATVEAVSLMSRTVAGAAGIKAAGGIRNTETALAMIEAGATRIGCSATLDILNGLPE